MEILIKTGERSPAMTWALFVWKFLIRSLEGIFSIDMVIWDYSKNVIIHQLFARKSFFSKDGAAILIKPDSRHVGRFIAYASVLANKEHIYEEITTIYNDRSYEFSIEKSNKSWKIIVDNKFIIVNVNTPIMTHKMLPLLSSVLKTSKDTIIKIDERNI